MLALMAAGAALFVLFRLAHAFMSRWPRPFSIAGSATFLLAVLALLAWLYLAGFEEAAWYISLGGALSSWVPDLWRLFRWLRLRRRSRTRGQKQADERCP